MRRLLNLIRPWPIRGERALFTLIAVAVAVAVLTGCRDSWTLATKDYANEVAADNAEAAKTNPLSALVHGVATLVASLAGAGVLVRRGIQNYDNRPMERTDGSRVSEAEIADSIPRKA